MTTTDQQESTSKSALPWYLVTCRMGRGTPGSKGYPRVGLGGGRTVYVRKLVYEEAHGLIPEGLRLVNLCRNRSCVRLQHLAVMTPAEVLELGPTYALRPKPYPRARRPLTRKKMQHQGVVEWRRPEGALVGMLVYEPAADDEHGKTLLVPVGDSFDRHRVDWASVERGEWWRANRNALTVNEYKLLFRYIRKHGL
ncbi:HNH endonuclease [Streptomyces goshikiensis]|uniref:HNH endonuclease n=1 Tax=Streptomyces goshikiensis TaxID=1942 RepID=UPI0036A22840